MMFYETAAGHGLPHDPFKAIVSPRPIGWISTRSEDGGFNIGPYSFFNAVSSRPPLVLFSSDGDKDSSRNARATGEFVANLVSQDLAEQMIATAINAPHEVSEFDLSGLTPAECRIVKAPRIAEAHAALECVVTEIFRPKDRHGQEIDNLVVMGEVVGVHIDEAMLTDGIFDVAKTGNVARLGYLDYTAVTGMFARRQPRWQK
jgi:flavin reductase (DIM6/NTAB) family NADH-FMN oxidoreductase RutF